MFILIDSKDRDVSTYANPNCFTIDLPNAISDIYSIELMNFIIINCKVLNDTPYLLLVLDELGHGIEATNIIANKAFTILSDYTILDGYRHYKINSVMMHKKFPTAISLSRLTVKVKNANGDICELPASSIDSGNSGDSGDSNAKIQNTTIQLIMKLTCGK
jgi:hypothetical protein